MRHLLPKLRALAVFREVLEDEAIAEFVSLLEALETEDAPSAASSVGLIWNLLAAGRGDGSESWRSRVEGAILDSESTFARLAEAGGVTDVVREQASLELAVMQELSWVSARTVMDGVVAIEPALAGAWAAGWPDDGVDLQNAVFGAATGAWSGLVGELESHFRANGSGVFGRYRAFRWGDSGLKPVPEPDTTLPKDLVGYEGEREALTRNTERFVRGVPAQHALLYGPPGTGKSSTVKAVFNAHSEEGLRLVEVGKERLSELPRLLEVLRGRGLRFIIYVDDLSFEEDEVEYKSLKALIEGSIESPPGNVRVYATSNRRNLIRESFSEREGDDVHAKDTMGEKLSLAARFGLRITFPNPDQNAYLDIVRGIAEERGLKLSEAEIEVLEDVALKRERWSSSRNGRAARQAVDDFEAARA